MDSNDRERIGEARDELMRMLAEDELREAVLLIFANKQVSFAQILIRSLKRVTELSHLLISILSFLSPLFRKCRLLWELIPYSLSISGFAQRYERCRDYWQIGSAFSKKQELVHSGKNT